MSLLDDGHDGPPSADHGDERVTLRAIISRAEALDLLESWLDTHPERRVEAISKRAGKVRIHLSAGYGSSKHYRSDTQETVESAIRTVLGIAYSDGER